MKRAGNWSTWGTSAPVLPYAYGGRSGGPVSEDSALTLPAVAQAVRIAAEAVAKLELTTWTGDGVERRKKPGTWQARLFRNPNPYQNGFEFLETIEESLTLRGNAYIWRNVDPATNRTVEMYALHPDQAVHHHADTGRCQWKILVGGDFLDPTGRGQFGVVDATSRNVLHIRGPRGGARCLAPSPVEAAADSLGSALAKIRRERSYYEDGALVDFVMSFPSDVTPEQAQEFRELWTQTYQGAKNAGNTPIIGGGPNITPITMTNSDAQFVEAAGLSIEDIARVFNVPGSLIGVGASRGPQVLSPEHEEDRWLRWGLEARLHRIEWAFRSDPYLFGPSQTTYPRFDTSAQIRGDLKTESERNVAEKQAGIITANEARAERGLPPVEGGDVLQKTPVGGAPGDTGDNSDQTPDGEEVEEDEG